MSQNDQDNNKEKEVKTVSLTPKEQEKQPVKAEKAFSLMFTQTEINSLLQYLHDNNAGVQLFYMIDRRASEAIEKDMSSDSTPK